MDLCSYTKFCAPVSKILCLYSHKVYGSDGPLKLSLDCAYYDTLAVQWQVLPNLCIYCSWPGLWEEAVYFSLNLTFTFPPQKARNPQALSHFLHNTFQSLGHHDFIKCSAAFMVCSPKIGMYFFFANKFHFFTTKVTVSPDPFSFSPQRKF